MDSLLYLFTKPPLPGRVKTRLIGALTPAEAAELHQCFLEDLAERLSCGGFALSLAWAPVAGGELAPAPPGSPLAALESVIQSGADLGERLYRALAEGARDHARVGAVGSDHPQLSAATVERGFALLAGPADLVLGPARDGGYYFVGLKAAAVDRRLFADIPWSTAGVLAATLERAAELELTFELLEEGDDVDTPADLERLAAALAAGRARCPRTRRLLAAWGHLVPA